MSEDTDLQILAGILTGDSERISAISFLMGVCLIVGKEEDDEEKARNIRHNMLCAFQALGVHPMEVSIAVDALSNSVREEGNGDGSW